ncbi:MAG: sigma 54-interacting transcriptional regulator [Polyangiaceae bacterium]
MSLPSIQVAAVVSAENFSGLGPTIVRDSGPAPLSVAVRVLGDRRSSSFRLRSGRCTIGSSKSCDIVIDDENVSRRHLELELAPEGVRVTDLGSTNGTFYLDQRIDRMVVGLGATIRIARVTISLEADSGALETVAVGGEVELHGMVGSSIAMRRLFGVMRRLEGSLATVLIEGDSGVGKELVAKAIHEGSRVASGSLVIVNCGAVARDLVASELFGHRRGAFTGAVDSRKGAFETAEGGTLFLDEIGELPLDVQPMLLRAIEAREVRAIGSDQAKPTRVRIVAATNRDLEAEVRAGTFRQDLYYRLAVVKVRVPALRERTDDITVLARRFGKACGIDELPQDLLERLKARSWAGNVRELRNVVASYAVLGILADEGSAQVPHLDSALATFADPSLRYEEQKDAVVASFTRAYLQKLMAASNGNQSLAARTAGLDRTYLGRLLLKYGMR